MKQSVEVDLAGQRLVIRTDEGPAYVRELADYVDAMLGQLAGDNQRSTLNIQRMALLVAIALADELFREKDLHRQYRQQVNAKLELLDAALAEHARRIADLDAQPPASADQDQDASAGASSAGSE